MGNDDLNFDIFDVADRVFEKLNSGGFNKLSEPEKIFICVWNVDGELNSGGFDQFYFNESGNLAKVTPVCLQKIGAPKAAKLVLAANQVFGSDGPPQNMEKRNEQLSNLPEDKEETLKKLEAMYHEHCENIEKLIIEHIVKHKEIFGIS